MREFVCDPNKTIVIESLSDFDKIIKEKDPEGKAFAYRGQGCCIWGISSLLERKIEETEKEKGGPIDHALFELNLIEKYKEESEKDGENDGSKHTTYGLLAKMQHYEIPTRLLDVTYDPLVALYFACSSSAGMNGRVIPFPRTGEAQKCLLIRLLAYTAQMVKNNTADLETIYQIHAALAEKSPNTPEVDKKILDSILGQGVMVHSPCYTDNQNMQKGSFVLTLNAYKNKTFINRITIDDTDSSELLLKEGYRYCIIPFAVIIPACKKTKILEELKSRKYCEETLLPEKDKIEKYAHILEEVKKGTKVL